MISYFFLQANSQSQSSSSEIDEGPAAKLARFNDDLSAELFIRKAHAKLSKKEQFANSNEFRSDDDVSESL